MTARLPLIDIDTLTPEHQAIVGNWRYNLHQVLANSPDSLVKWFPFALHILADNKLPARDREIAIMRVAWNCRSDYEWGLHAQVSRSVGITEPELAAVVVGADDPSWPPHEAALIRAVDEMQRDWRISDATWAALAAHYRPEQLVDFVLLTGEFILVALAIGAFAIPLEPGAEGLPAAPVLDAR